MNPPTDRERPALSEADGRLGKTRLTATPYSATDLENMAQLLDRNIRTGHDIVSCLNGNSVSRLIAQCYRALASPKPALTQGGVVELVARMVDPGSWRAMDSYLEVARRKNADFDPDAFKDAESMAIATEILAAIAANLGGETWRCFHCDFSTSDPDEAREHFGPTPLWQAWCIDARRDKASLRRELITSDTNLTKAIKERDEARTATALERLAGEGGEEDQRASQTNPVGRGLPMPPEGWRLVPIKPSADMLAAVFGKMPPKYTFEHGQAVAQRDRLAFSYAIMVDAAPPPESGADVQASTPDRRQLRDAPLNPKAPDHG